MFDGNRYSISATNLLNHQGYAFWQVNVDRNHHHSYYHIMFSLDSNRPRVENYPTYKINNEPTVYIEEIAYKKFSLLIMQLIHRIFKLLQIINTYKMINE